MAGTRKLFTSFFLRGFSIWTKPTRIWLQNVDLHGCVCVIVIQSNLSFQFHLKSSSQSWNWMAWPAQYFMVLQPTLPCTTRLAWQEKIHKRLVKHYASPCMAGCETPGIEVIRYTSVVTWKIMQKSQIGSTSPICFGVFLKKNWRKQPPPGPGAIFFFMSGLRCVWISNKNVPKPGPF